MSGMPLHRLVVPFPIDLATGGSAVDGAELLLEAALRLRDAEGWLTRRPARTELPSD